jgi:hypothetical protein
MTKYLVIANIYPYGYGIDNTLFGIFNTKEEAVQWIINNPTHEMGEEKPFDFFEWYEEEKVVDIYEYIGETTKLHLRPRKTKTGERTISKEEYAEKYIREFDGSPLCVGFYVE